MKLTFTTHGGELMTLDLADDMELENVKALCEMDLRVPTTNMILSANGQRLTDNKKTLQDSGLKDGDVVLVETSVPNPGPPRLQSGPTPSKIPKIDFSSISVPGPGTSSSGSRSQPIRPNAGGNSSGVSPAELMRAKAIAENIRESIKQHPATTDSIRERFPQVLEAALKDDFATIAQLTRKEEEEAARRTRLLFTNPDSHEAQQMIQDQIRRQIIERSKPSGSGKAGSNVSGSSVASSSQIVGKDGDNSTNDSDQMETNQFQKSFASKTTNIVKNKNLPWVDKYRPKTVGEIAFQSDVVKVLQNALKGEDFPHFLFYGPPGTGKTSAILAVCRELFGLELMKERVLELNASDERGISVVREKVKTFAQYSTTSIRPDGKACPPFKVIIMDEADSMTNAAQAALRRIMEKESKSTRFCLICNYISRIIEPLASRCARFRFKPLPTATIKTRLLCIGEQENVKIEDPALDALIRASDGDLRRAITLLQSISKLVKDVTVTRSDVLELTGYIPDEHISAFFETCQTNDYDKVQSFVQGLIYAGFSAGQLFDQLQESVLENGFINDVKKAAIIERLAIADHRLMDGADEFLQMMDVGATVMQTMSA